MATKAGTQQRFEKYKPIIQTVINSITAVEKIKGLTSEIEQLKADNDALRSKCTELTKALTDKTEFNSQTIHLAEA